MKHSKYPYGPGRQDYVSEFTRFIDGYLDAHPEVVQKQADGWRIWWERPQVQALKELDRAMHADQPHPTYYSYYYE